MKHEFLEPNMRRWVLIGILNLFIFVLLFVAGFRADKIMLDLPEKLMWFAGGIFFAWALTGIGWERSKRHRYHAENALPPDGDLDGK